MAEVGAGSGGGRGTDGRGGRRRIAWRAHQRPAATTIHPGESAPGSTSNRSIKTSHTSVHAYNQKGQGISAAEQGAADVAVLSLENPKVGTRPIQLILLDVSEPINHSAPSRGRSRDPPVNR